nr:NADH dehydrogenase subunit 6 [Hecalus sp.]
MMIIMKMMMTVSSLTPFLKTPMSMGILLLTQTTLSTILMAKTLKSSWMSMIMFLMLIGGLMILFMYMSSIASNEKFTPNIKMTLLFIILLMIPNENMMMELQMQDNLKEILMTESIIMTKIYNKKTMMITIMMFMYLFLAMIAVTSIIKIHKGPLRSMLK